MKCKQVFFLWFKPQVILLLRSIYIFISLTNAIFVILFPVLTYIPFFFSFINWLPKQIVCLRLDQRQNSNVNRKKKSAYAALTKRLYPKGTSMADKRIDVMKYISKRRQRSSLSNEKALGLAHTIGTDIWALFSATVCGSPKKLAGQRRNMRQCREIQNSSYAMKGQSFH